ncbi:tRNA-i(6)A37 thiotransferase enzyme MiaB [Alkalispirochaeta americana]|uniref:tRNA-2-methylthio-N(6)-dimethylallyladenosine synthase n=1 Tax=Alkalispirochaeta americana TaxID=159291 RepID=A0A1N6NFW8_9SPIO|nr:tRNA (N6-isopentenyl adenosine(37)-C2)-methylthiotransferase MiaB [Alkalispirochaeta americana]SIP90943.1 tRNA-i(6)A37 thiotransferase enzyme MiaB [Alkalispirochaeta americana]
MYYYLLPLGCQMNLSDAERIRTVLEEAGYTSCQKEEEADLIGLVACSVRQKAIDKVYSKIHKWNQWKEHRPLITFASGCILPEDHRKLLGRFDLIFSIQDLPQLPQMLRQYGVTTALNGTFPALRDEPPPPSETGLDSYWKVPPTYSSSFEAYVPIQNGCDKFCTFCAVPYTRGREVSRPSGEILREIETLLDRGYRTITLLGQNVNSYGLDRHSREITFPELLDRIGALTRGHPLWVYFTSPHPRDMKEDVLEKIAAYPTLAKQIHLPLQSGDDTVLTRMNRNYQLRDYRSVTDSIGRILPGATLFTDIIVGFTGETEEQFLNTCAAMEEFRFNMAYIAQYSPRPGAVSSRWADDVPQEIKKERLHRLTRILEETSGAFTRSLPGTTQRVLVDGFDRKPGFLSGKTEGRIPVRMTDPGNIEPGSFVTVRITDARPLSVAGEILPSSGIAPGTSEQALAIPQGDILL